MANRVLVKNDGRSAATGCKGVLKITKKEGTRDIENEVKIRWIIPQEQYKMTINKDSLEYLDVCAVLKDDPEVIHKKFLKNLNELDQQMKNIGEYETKVVRAQIADLKEECSVEKIYQIVAPNRERLA